MGVLTHKNSNLKLIVQRLFRHFIHQKCVFYPTCKTIYFVSREAATTESPEEFGARRRVPLTRTRTARPRPAAAVSQQDSAEQQDQRFNRYTI